MKIDIVKEVVAMLGRHDIVNHDSFADDYADYHETHRTDIDDVDDVTGMNSYWRYIVARLDHLRGEGTRITNAMNSLTSSNSRREWLNNFDRYVIPILTRGRD